MTTSKKHVGPIIAVLLLTLLLAACGDSTDNLSINGITTTAPATTVAPSTANGTTVAATTAQATTAVATTSVPATTAAPVTTVAPVTTAAPATTAAPVTVKPPTTTATPVKVNPTTAPATTGPIAGQEYGPKGACSADALAKAAGSKYKVSVDIALQIKNGNTATPVKVVMIGEKADGSDFYENTRGYVIANNCTTLPGAYRLPSSKDFGWGDYPPEIKVQNTHNDGREQILIEGVVGAHTSVASLYSFDPQKGVKLQGDLVGDWGAGFRNPEFYGGNEKDVAYYAWRNYGRAQTVVVNYLRWQPDGAGEGKYVGFESYVTYAFETPDELQYPEQAILAYYRALTLKKYDVAFNLLGNAYKNGQTLDKYKAGYATTKRVWVESFEVVGLDPAKFEETIADGSYDVKVEIAAEDVKDGKSVITHFGGTWTVSVKGNVLKLEKANIVAK